MHKPEHSTATSWRDAAGRLLAAALVAAREQRGCSQSALANIAGLDRSHLSDVEKGRAVLTFDLLMNVLEALKLEPRNFFLRPELSALRSAYRRGPPPPTLGYQARVHQSYAQMLGDRMQYDRGRRTTQARLARDAGIARSHISRIENAAARPSVVLILALLQAMEIDPAKFFDHIHLHPVDLTGPLGASTL